LETSSTVAAILPVQAPAVEKTKLCMMLFLASEALFFVLLILAYIYFHPAVSDGPSAPGDLDPKVTGIYTVLLLASSGTIWLAGRGLKKRSGNSFFGWLAITVILGVVFLAGQGIEYAKLLGEHVTISRNLFGTTFFTLTGIHGIHVLIGLILLAVLLGLALGGDGGRKQSVAFESASLYWHFVDAVWVVIFSIVYLWSAS
jgi:heme/copper-type cytochrome/quinol oxidase subunit 3